MYLRRHEARERQKPSAAIRSEHYLDPASRAPAFAVDPQPSKLLSGMGVSQSTAEMGTTLGVFGRSVDRGLSMCPK